MQPSQLFAQVTRGSSYNLLLTTYDDDDAVLLSGVFNGKGHGALPLFTRQHK